MKQQPRYVKQYVSGVLDYSSQYGSENPRSFSYSISNIVGEPKIFPKYGDYTQAAVMRTYGPWWRGNDDDCDVGKDTRPLSSNFRSDDYIDLIFEQAVYPWSIAIYETYNPGGLVRILAMCQQFPDLPQSNADNLGRDDNNEDETANMELHNKLIPMPPYGCSHWEVLWENKSLQNTNQSLDEARMFAPILQEINHRTRIIRLEFCHSNLDYYTEIDAVELTGTLHFYRSTSVDPPILATNNQSETSILNLVATDNDKLENATEYHESKVDLLLDHHQIIEKNNTIPTNDVTKTIPSSDDVTTMTSPVYGCFSYLPCEIINKIFEYLPLPDLLLSSKVCRLFRDHSYDRRHYLKLNIQPYWHSADVHLLNSICARFQPPDVATELSECKINDKNEVDKKSIQSINMSWMGGCDVITEHQLTTFLAECHLTTLRHLDMTSSPCMNDEALKLITLQINKLEYLNIQSCDKLTSEGIRILGDLSNLTYLNLYRTQVDDAGIICIIQHNKELKNINLASCMKIADYNRIFEEIGQHCKKMKCLDVWRAKSLTSYGVEQLLDGCHYIEQLDLGWCIGLMSSSGVFQNIAQSCPNLKKLFLTANRTLCDADILQIANSCPKLELLDILGTRLVTRSTIQLLLSSCLNLKFLDLSFCYSFSYDVIETLRTNYPNISIKRSFQN